MPVRIGSGRGCVKYLISAGSSPRETMDGQPTPLQTISPPSRHLLPQHSRLLPSSMTGGYNYVDLISGQLYSHPLPLSLCWRCVCVCVCVILVYVYLPPPPEPRVLFVSIWFQLLSFRVRSYLLQTRWSSLYLRLHFVFLSHALLCSIIFSHRPAARSLMWGVFFLSKRDISVNSCEGVISRIARNDLYVVRGIVTDVYIYSDGVLAGSESSTAVLRL